MNGESIIDHWMIGGSRFSLRFGSIDEINTYPVAVGRSAPVPNVSSETNETGIDEGRLLNSNGEKVKAVIMKWKEKRRKEKKREGSTTRDRMKEGVWLEDENRSVNMKSCPGANRMRRVVKRPAYLRQANFGTRTSKLSSIQCSNPIPIKSKRANWENNISQAHNCL
jgi:hypothetical protein